MTDGSGSGANELERLRQRVTELEQQVAKASRDAELYQLIIDALPQSIFWKDPELRYLGANRRFLLDAGIEDIAELLGKSDEEMPWAAQAASYRANDRAVLAENEAHLAYEELQERVDGQAWVLTNKTPLRWRDGELIGVLGEYEDITARKNSEQERLIQQEQVIQAQQDTLRELSTPLIPLADNIVAMPVIGRIDTARSSQIMETLLEGIAQYQADIALLDISGVHVVDTQVADALLRTARAAKLLGTTVMLTGMSAEIAQTIVLLGADLSATITFANLQDGLRYAMTMRQ